jgi:serine/threonine protein kinase
VYRINQADYFGKQVAVKVLNCNICDMETVHMVEDDAAAMHSASGHPNVLEFIGTTEINGKVAIVSEFIPGMNLHEYISRYSGPDFGPFDRTWVWQVALDIAHGLSHLHQKGITHGNLTSTKVLLNDQKRAKVYGFGFQRITTNVSYAFTNKTHDDRYRWHAPEQFDRKVVKNNKVDVWSFGVILWELTTRQDPWDGMSPSEVVDLVLIKKETLAIPPDCDESLALLMKACWRYDPSLRPSFDQLVHSMESFIPQLQQPPPPPQ